jgi:hypothetical protein
MHSYDGLRFNPAAPVASVTLRTLDGSKSVFDVPMLIDSGADVILLPREFVDRRSLVVDDVPRYELVGFDGTKSKASSVQLDLLFLQRAFTDDS